MAIDISGFLTEGTEIPTGSALKATQSETILPEWYTNYAMNLLSNQNAVLNQPYQSFQGPRVAEFSPAQQQGFAMTGQAANAYQPALNAATGATTNLMGQSSMTAAQPYLNKAAGDATNVSAYMNPYTQNVVDQVAAMGARNLSENLLPALTSKYINAGQLGFGPRGGAGTPSGLMTDTARALRDVQEATLSEQGKLLNQGYQQAQTAAQADLARQAGLASTAGNIAGGDITRQLGAAEQLGALGTAAQSLGLKGAEAVGGVGTQQQAQAQKNIDTAYADFLRQQGYPQQQIDKAAATFGAVGSNIPMAKQEYGIVPTGATTTANPSTADTIAGGISTLAGLLKDFKVI